MAKTAWDHLLCHLLCCGGLASEIARFLLSSGIALFLLALALAAPLPVAPLPRTHRHLTPSRRPGGGGYTGKQPKTETVLGMTGTGTGTVCEVRWWWVVPRGSFGGLCLEAASVGCASRQLRWVVPRGSFGGLCLEAASVGCASRQLRWVVPRGSFGGLCLEAASVGCASRQLRWVVPRGSLQDTCSLLFSLSRPLTPPYTSRFHHLGHRIAQ
jgi:hypothetical protein